MRQAEDIGAQELSYAEVKAIASGNPAVLTLAEADAMLHRLHLLQKHHADEQYLARRQLRALPGDITRLERRVAALTQDIATAATHATDLVTIGTRPYSRHDALEALAARLQALPALVYETRHVPLGLVHGLRFGLVQHPQGAPEVYIEGALRRSVPLARDVHGPRAILNAVERLIGSAEAERDKARRDLEIAQGQRRDYEARLGAVFAHAAYLEALTDLRNQLEAALSRPAQDGAEEALPPVGVLVERLKALHAAHTLDAVPERAAPRRTATVEEAITTRIRQREQAEVAPSRAGASPPTPASLPATAPGLRPCLPRHRWNPGRLPSSCACSRHRRGGGTNAVCSPHPQGALPLAGSPGGTGGCATLPAPWRHRSAALGFLPGGARARRRAGLLGLRLSLYGFPPSLEGFAI